MEEKVRLHPLRSSRADDPALADAIDDFVVGLAERVDALQDAEMSGDLKPLAELAAALGADAAAHGYEPLLRCARDVERACSEDDPQAARRGVVEITELARRVRLGHRGAA